MGRVKLERIAALGGPYEEVGFQVELVGRRMRIVLDEPIGDCPVPGGFVYSFVLYGDDGSSITSLKCITGSFSIVKRMDGSILRTDTNCFISVAGGWITGSMLDAFGCCKAGTVTEGANCVEFDYSDNAYIKTVQWGSVKRFALAASN